ncbi:hypothetical protein G7Y79_00019g046520 [Physcia stellaris]|nr:hypothetical protein G7Y79_00019g046520 [Physcia stellaris]
MFFFPVFDILALSSSLALGKADDHVEKRTFVGDPRSNITCLGSSYDLRIPIRTDGVDLNQLTMQQLCAKPIYGGANISRALGGWCVSFDFSVSEEMSDHLANFNDDRLYIGCLNRCFCNWEIEDRSIQPKREVPSNADVIIIPTHPLHVQKLKVEIPEFLEARDNQPALDGDEVTVVQIITDLHEPTQRNYPLHSQTDARDYEDVLNLALDPGNEITCEGDLPSFALPPPYSVADFQNAQQLCAVQWFGGLSGANAGGYCHRSNPHAAPGASEFDNQVWFSDEMTPRYEYTWGGGNFFLSASLRTYCYAHCYCTSVGKKATKHRTFTVWQFLRNHALILRGSGSIDYGERGPLDTGVFQKLATVLPARSGNAPYASGTCGADARQFCPSQWPEAEFGPIPRAPPFTSDIVLPPSPKKDLTICGNKCTGQSDCSTTRNGYECDCALPNVEDARVLGLDPVAPPSICLSLALLAFGGKASSLHGRDGVGAGYVDREGVPYQCRIADRHHIRDEDDVPGL